MGSGAYNGIPTGVLLRALAAISLGTIIEWYDFTIYTQLSKTLGKLFFPNKDPVLTQLSFWGVYALGFISRPAGAIMFGHIGDSKGRGMCLLLSVLLMGIPTVLIGCLPTYNHIGLAAPILLAFLRLVQGLAMGGEFGAAMVYLHEIAVPKFKALTGSLGYISLGIGVVIGILMTVLMVAVTSPEAFEVWGWRVPFLISITSLVAAIYLRSNMPESHEFIANREEINEEYQRRIHQTTGAPKAKVASPVTAELSKADGDVDVDIQSFAEEGGQANTTTKHYVPVVELFRGHWLALILQVGYEAWIGAGFYIGYSFMPSFFATHVGIPQQTTLWMVLSCMILYTFIVPIAGYLSDKGMPRVWACIACYVLSGATSVPMFMAFQTKSLALCWVLQAFALSMAAFTMGLLPTVCSLLYPAGVRISGFNFGYNVGMTLFGGTTPLAITAIQAKTGSIFGAPAYWMVAVAGFSIIMSLFLLRVHPHCDRTPKSKEGGGEVVAVH